MCRMIMWDSCVASQPSTTITCPEEMRSPKNGHNELKSAATWTLLMRISPNARSHCQLILCELNLVLVWTLHTLWEKTHSFHGLTHNSSVQCAHVLSGNIRFHDSKFRILRGESFLLSFHNVPESIVIQLFCWIFYRKTMMQRVPPCLLKSTSHLVTNFLEWDDKICDKLAFVPRSWLCNGEWWNQCIPDALIVRLETLLRRCRQN